LIERYRAGDAAVVDMLVHTHQQAVFRLALSILDDPAEADEAAQDAFVAAINALPSFRGESAFTTWLYRITVNACRGRLRRERTRQRLRQALVALLHIGEDAALKAAPHPEEHVIQTERDNALWQGIRALDDRHRLPLVLHYYQGLPTAEIAAILGISEGTVHSRLHTARQRLRTYLKVSDDEPG
jgi:RNA polymerase sigma-70 factor (ECF subfamily)